MFHTQRSEQSYPGVTPGTIHNTYLTARAMLKGNAFKDLIARKQMIQKTVALLIGAKRQLVSKNKINAALKHFHTSRATCKFRRRQRFVRQQH